jgi:hypothetical protein
MIFAQGLHMLMEKKEFVYAFHLILYRLHKLHLGEEPLQVIFEWSLDSLLHHAEVIRLQGRSYRMHHRKELHDNPVIPTLTEKN